MQIDGVFYRTFKIERLYFRYIINTELKTRGITAKKLADILQDLGLILIIENGDRYVELPKFAKHAGFFSFAKLWKEQNGLLYELLSGE